MAKLFKYRSLEGKNWDYTLDLLINNKLYFAPANSYNDPYETEFRIKYNSWSDLIELFVRVEIKNTGINEEEARKKVEHVLSRVSKEQIEMRLWEAAYNMSEYAGQRVGVYCLCGNPYDLLMWGHYSFGHRGICIQFEDQTINQMFNNSLYKVKYQNELPSLEISKLLSSQFHIDAYRSMDIWTTKSNDWKYEQEWRIFDIIRGPGVHPINSRIISKVLLGRAIDKELRVKLISELESKASHIQILQAVPLKSKYGLTFIDIRNNTEVEI